MYGWVGPWRKLSTKELMLLNYSVGEDSWESLGLQGVQTNPKGNQSWIFIGRTDAEAQCFGHLMWRTDSLEKDPDAGKDWRQEKKRMTEDEMVGWHHRLNGHAFEQALGVGDGQGSLVCCSPWGHKELEELDTTEQLNWTELKAGREDRRMRFLQGLQKTLTYFWEYLRSCAWIRMWACSKEGPRRPWAFTSAGRKWDSVQAEREG